MSKPKILITDDEKPTRDVMARVLSGSYDCLTAADAEQAMQIITATPDLDLLLTDYKMPGDNGVELIKKAKSVNPTMGAILITAFGEIDLAVEAMKDGADDFMTKPITDLAKLEFRIAKALEKCALRKRIESEETKNETSDDGLEAFIGRSPAMERVYHLIRKVAPTEASVLIEGPSGSGKELTAHAIHEQSKRAKGPFVAVECSSLTPTLLEAELFGSIKGAYTGSVADRAGCFETADGGTLFLDEIGEIDANVQVKLLRVLETHTFQRVGETKERRSDFRLVTATNKSLAKLVAEGRFREDLYYRLNVIDIRTPALREHKEDIEALALKFLKQFSKENGGTVSGIERPALKALEDYDWPGNVRQLRNVIEKMVVLAAGPKLTLEDVPEDVKRRTVESPAVVPSAVTSEPVAIRTVPAAVGETSLADQEKSAILDALAKCGGNKSKAADLLGISRRTIHRKLNAWGIQ